MESKLIVWLASFPRSGNTYLRTLLHCVYGIETYSIHNNDQYFLQNNMAKAIGHRTLPDSVDRLMDDEKLYLVKTHYRPTDEKMPQKPLPAIYIVRDGRDATVSYARYNLSLLPRRGKKGMLVRLRKTLGLLSYERTLKLMITNPNRYGSWSTNVFSWLRYAETAPTAILQFEDLINDPVNQLTGALQKLEIDIKPVGDELPDFDTLKVEWPDFFRRGKTGSYRDEFPDHLRQMFWNLNAAALEYFGYPSEQ